MEAIPQPGRDTRPRSGGTVLAWLLAGAAAAAWSVLMGILLLVIPRFEQIYSDFGVGLTGVGRAVLGVSRGLRGANQGFAWGWPSVLLLLSALGGAAFLASRPRGRLPGVVLLIIAILLPIAAIGVVAVVMYVPLVEMIESLQTGQV